MARTTVDYGIDLGTTNSAIAVLTGTSTEIVKNNEDAEFTPSAVHIDGHGTVFVGQEAKNLLWQWPESTASEFKLRMGRSDATKVFEPTGRPMEPEDLSAEVLKSLRADVRQRRGEDIQAAVITVPAAFEKHAIAATKRAATRAGLSFAPFVREPTAAAYAYGFHSTADGFWLVYDLGGGTFDAAIVQLRDDQVTVARNAGDPDLGGKLIDWEIVEKLLIPAVVADRPLADFGRGVPRWRSAINKLKLAAETAKVTLSRRNTAKIAIDFLCDDDEGRRVELVYDLSRDDVERLAEPYYARSLNHCRRALREAHLTPGDIEKVVLVGGPTLAPRLREMLTAELGIELDVSQDPLTVVARGAAIFAGTQQVRLPATPRRAGQYTIEWEHYEPMGAVTDPLIAGRVVAGGGASTLPDGLTVEFEDRVDDGDTRPVWRSGKVAVDGEGRFDTKLYAEKGKRHSYAVSLTDGSGQPLDVTPDVVVYTAKFDLPQPELLRTLGLGLAGNEMLTVLHAGEPQPVRRVVHLKTLTEVVPEQGTGSIKFPFLEGNRPRADRNRQVGTFELTARDAHRRIRAGSQIEVTMEVDEDGHVSAMAYIPQLDRHVPGVLGDVTITAPDRATLQSEADEARARYAELAAKVRDNPTDLDARARLEQVESEGVVEELNDLVAASPYDADAATSAARRTTDLHAALDDVEAALHWPELAQDARDLTDRVREVIDKAGNLEEKETFAELERQVTMALETRDPNYLKQRCDNLRRLEFVVLDRTGIAQRSMFEYLKTRVPEMSNQLRAAQLVNEGERAVLLSQAQVLRNVNFQLAQLLPNEHAGRDERSNVVRDGQ